jgi:hypothetical protein
MHAIHDASEQERHIRLESTCRRPEILSAEALSRRGAEPRL